MQNFFGEERILVLFLVPVALFAPLGRRGLGARIEGPFVNPLFPFVTLCIFVLDTQGPLFVTYFNEISAWFGEVANRRS